MRAFPSICVLFAATFSANAAVNLTTTFSAAEGYVAGGLDRDDNASQPRNWERVNAAQPNSFMVGPPGITITPREAGTIQAVSQNALNLSEGSVTTSIDFTFSQSGVAPAGNQTVVGMAYLSDFASGNISGFSGAFQLTTTGYQISWGTTSTSITAAQLGINTAASDFQSSPLRMSMTLTRTGTGDTFTRTASLFDMTNGSLITSTAPQSFTSSATYSDSAIYTSMTSGYTTVSEITGVAIQRFTIDQIPEPNSLGLGIFSGLLLLKRSRPKI